MRLMNPYKLLQGIFIPNGILCAEISNSAKLCYGILSRYAGRYPVCNPKQRTLATELGLSVVQVRRTLNELESSGFITRKIVQKETGNGAKSRSTYYQFPFHKSFRSNRKSTHGAVEIDDVSQAIKNDCSIIDNINILSISNPSDKSSGLDVFSSDKSSEKIKTFSSSKLRRRPPSRILKEERGKLAKPKPSKPLPMVPAKVRSVLKYWDAKGLHTRRSEGSKSYQQDVEKVKRLFSGTAFTDSEFDEWAKHRFGIKEIRAAIDRFALAAMHPHYLPTGNYKRKLKGTGIGDFIYCPFASNGVGRSQFLFYLENEPKLSMTPVLPLEDAHPRLSSALRREYRREILGGADTKFSVIEENHFKLGAEKLVAFIKKNNRRIMWHREVTPVLLASWVMEAIKKATGEDLSKVTPGWFSSDVMYNRRLPAYLTSQALMGGEDRERGVTRVGLLHE